MATASPMAERYGDWALVTGASSGIGKSLATGLAQRGLNVVLVSDQAPELSDTAEDLARRFSIDARVCHVDLAGTDVLSHVADATRDIRVSVVVNNASFGVVGPFQSKPLSDYDTLVAVNVRAYVALTHHFLPGMVAAGRGALIFVSSINALSPIGGSAVYTASKAFELSFGGALWYELRGTGVDVQIVLPGPTKTGFQKKAGTKVATWAMEPDEVAAGALDALGSALLYIPGERNRGLAKMADQLPFEQRIVAASEYLHRALIDGVDPDA